MAPTTDRLARPMRDLRISVTDRCNLRCRYCMPREIFGREFTFMSSEELLSFEEITRLCAAFASHGVQKIRITGGEPLVRRQLERLVEMIGGLEGINDIALTTNGTMLAAKAHALARAGLGRVTVSLDALDEEVFRTMSDTRIPLARVLEGIEAAAAAGLSPVKINMVVRRGINDHCFLEMAERFRGSGHVLRFIEYMDVGTTNGWRLQEVVPAREILRAIDARWPLEALQPRNEGEVASRYRYLDGAGEIGLIHSVSQPFCAHCTRARLAADGMLYTCLFASHGHDLREVLRGGAGDVELAQHIGRIWRARGDRYSAERALSTAARRTPRVEMSYIGG